MDMFLIVIIVLAGVWASVHYVRWLGPRPKAKETHRPKTTPGTREHTEENLMKIFALINPFRDFWYELKLFGGLVAVIAVGYGLIYVVVK